MGRERNLDEVDEADEAEEGGPERRRHPPRPPHLTMLGRRHGSFAPSRCVVGLGHGMDPHPPGTVREV